MRLYLSLFLTVFLVSVSAYSAVDPKTLKIGLVLDKGGKDDKSFNSSAYQGATEAQKRLGFSLKVMESQDDNAIEPSMRNFAQKNYDLIIGIGFIQQDAVKKVAKDFPNVPFVLVDAHVDLPNVRSVIFKEHEGSYLVGAIAALSSKTKKVGMVGGMKIPLIQRFAMGYEAGAKQTVPGIKVSIDYVGSDSSAWRDPAKAKELALKQYGAGIDTIFIPAGASGLGVLDAAEQKQKFVIGCDSNQNWIKPGLVLTSMLKRVDLVVKEAIDLKAQGKFVGGKFSLGIKEGAIDYSLDSYNRGILTPEVEKKANELKKQIISGKVKVPDFYQINRTNLGS